MRNDLIALAILVISFPIIRKCAYDLATALLGESKAEEELKMFEWDR